MLIANSSVLDKDANNQVNKATNSFLFDGKRSSNSKFYAILKTFFYFCSK